MAQLKDLIVSGSSRFIGNVFANTFTGNLVGNATTATSAASAGSATTCSYPAGFTGTYSWDWSGYYNVPGDLITGWQYNGADIQFRNENGALNVVTDGYFYQGIDKHGSLNRCLDTHDSGGNTLITSGNIGSQSVNYATSASSAGSASYASYLASQDLRSSYPASIVPSYNRVGLSFMQNSTLGIYGYGTYSDAIVVRGYADSSGGNENALIFNKNSNGVWHTQFSPGSTDFWGTPYLFLDSNNYKSFNTYDTLNTDSIISEDLIVNGAARFVSKISGDVDRWDGYDLSVVSSMPSSPSSNTIYLVV